MCITNFISKTIRIITILIPLLIIVCGTLYGHNLYWDMDYYNAAWISQNQEAEELVDIINEGRSMLSHGIILAEIQVILLAYIFYFNWRGRIRY